jgi:predicted DCC family thiol-disulfide oxidoreductase YuxK
VSGDDDTAGLREALEGAGAERADLIVVYDGDCVFCNSCVRLMRLRDSAGRVRLIDARQNDVAATVHRLTGLDLDEGMLVIYGDRMMYGADAVHMLAQMTSPSTAWNALAAGAFRRPALSRILYPAMKFGRQITLRALGRKPIRLDA